MESDIVSLSSDFLFTETKLVDVPLDAQHTIKEKSRPTMRALKKGITYSEWRQIKDLSNTEKSVLLGWLNMIGALSVQKNKSNPIVRLNSFITASILLYWPPALTYRAIASPSTIWLASLLSCRLILFLGLASSLLVSFTGIDNSAEIILYLVYGMALVFITVFLHEIMHWLFIKRETTSVVIMQQGLRLGILHQTISPATELMSSLAGPFGGVVSSLTISFVVSSLLHNGAFIIIGGIIGLFHLYSLMPWYGDGISIAKLIMRQNT